MKDKYMNQILYEFHFVDMKIPFPNYKCLDTGKRYRVSKLPNLIPVKDMMTGGYPKPSWYW